MSGEEFYCNKSDRNMLEFKFGYRVIQEYRKNKVCSTTKIFNSLREAHQWAAQYNNHGFYTYIEEISIAECRCI